MPTIYKWFDETLPSFELTSIILCFAAAIVKQLKLDRFLFFMGPSNTGKSTAIRLFDRLSNSVLTKQLSDISQTFGLSELRRNTIRLLVVRDSEGDISPKTAS